MTQLTRFDAFTDHELDLLVCALYHLTPQRDGQNVLVPVLDALRQEALLSYRQTQLAAVELPS
jgi:hypothetical protein